MQENIETIDISLIVLSYNRPKSLERCLDSILRMRKGDVSFEVIVVDDGSTADITPVISLFSETLNIRFFRKKENNGVASTRNFGARAARGNLVAFIADDYILPENYLIDVTDYLDEHSDAYVITHNIKPTGPSIFRYVQRLYFQLTLLQMFEGQNIKPSTLKSYSLPPSRAAVFRKDIFELVGYFNEDLHTGEDGEFGMRMASKNIPVYFFPGKYIEHWEDKDLLGYLDQRIRYGRSYFRAVYAQNPESRRKPSLGRIIKALILKYFSWLKLSHHQNRGHEYLILSPLLILFLIFYYSGFYLESKSEVSKGEGNNF